MSGETDIPPARTPAEKAEKAEKTEKADREAVAPYRRCLRQAPVA